MRSDPGQPGGKLGAPCELTEVLKCANTSVLREVFSLLPFFRIMRIFRDIANFIALALLPFTALSPLENLSTTSSSERAPAVVSVQNSAGMSSTVLSEIAFNS